MMWCRGYYKDHTDYYFPKAGKELVGDWETELEGRYEKGSTGYHILTNFQCNIFHFRNIKGRYTNSLRHEDEILMINIWWSSLEMFWNM